METIQNYLDSMFQAWPKTEETLEIKNELFTHMTDKYNELKGEGKSENEAVGIVISEFGNIDELMSEIGVKRTVDEDKGQNVRYVSRTEADAYISLKEKNGKRVGCGIVTILIGAACFILLSGVAEYLPGGEETLYGHMITGSALVLMLACVIAAVVLFIYSGTLEERYEYLNHAFRINGSLREELEMRVEDNRTSNMMAVILGTCLCIAAAIPVIIGGFVSDYLELAGNVSVCIALLLISAAVYLFVSSGSRKEALEKLLQKGEYAVKEKKEEKNRLVAIVSSIVWPLTVVAFLMWGFLGGGWGICWILFPVVGILYGAFCAVVGEVMKGRQGK